MNLELRRFSRSFFTARGVQVVLLSGALLASCCTSLRAQDAQTPAPATQEQAAPASAPATQDAPAAAPAQDAPAAAAPAQDATPTATVSNDTDKKSKTRKSKEEKKEEKVVQSKDTQKLLRRQKKDNPLADVKSGQPDKQLYDKAMLSLKKGRYDVSRLELQTLLATYPDSEYQMRAKLSYADSWYKEGGTAALTQAEAEYKDFITFFPNVPEAAEAQMRVGDIYFRQMDKPDRDYTKALHAQDEYRNMIQQFPDSPLVPDAKQRLRQVQEVLATRENDIGIFYTGRENWAAAIARYQTVADTYPLFSHIDDTLIGLGDAYSAQSRFVRLSKLPEDAKARLQKIYDDQAIAAYSRVVTVYSASAHVEDARDRLEAMGSTIPTPTPEQVAASQALESSRQGYKLTDRAKLMVFHGPDTVQAAHLGEPALADPKPTLAPQVTKRSIDAYNTAIGKPPTAPAAPAADGSTPAASADDTTAATAPAAPAAPLALQDVPSDTAAGASTDSSFTTATPSTTAPASTGGTGLGVQIITPGAAGTTTDAGSGLKAVGPANTTLPAIEKPEAAPDAINDVAGQKTPAAQAAPENGKKAPKPEFDKGDESSSKHPKKKGLKKLNPF